MKDYREMICWQKAIKLVKSIYQCTKSFPQSEIYGLRSQIQRASVSIPSNIAEGFGRNSNKDFLRFLCIAKGSLFELQTQLHIAFELDYISEEKFEILFEQTREVERILVGFMKSIS